MIADIDTVIRLGRLPYYIQLREGMRVRSDELFWDDSQVIRVEFDPDEQNCWGSKCRLYPELHMPCFDVDLPREAAEAQIKAIWTEYEEYIRWVPSTNNWHVYVDYPIPWKEYLFKLEAAASRWLTFTPDGVEVAVSKHLVQPNYVTYSRHHGQTFVRMPHIKKPPLPEPEEAESEDF